MLDVNPYPWKVPPFQPGRKGNRLFVQAGRDEGLHTYKEAIKEQLEKQNPTKIEGPVALFAWYWRRMDEYKSTRGRNARSHEADTTNLQKATEDALQGLVFDNDKDVVFTQSWRVIQDFDVQGVLVVCAYPWVWSSPEDSFPDHVQEKIKDIREGVIEIGPSPDNIIDYEIPF